MFLNGVYGGPRQGNFQELILAELFTKSAVFSEFLKRSLPFGVWHHKSDHYSSTRLSAPSEIVLVGLMSLFPAEQKNIEKKTETAVIAEEWRKEEEENFNENSNLPISTKKAFFSDAENTYERRT